MNSRPLKLLFIRLFFLMVLYSLVRMGFYFAHAELFEAHSGSVIAFSFLHGFRFDLAALCWINAVFVFSPVVPFFRQFWGRLLFFVLNGTFLIASLDDIELFSFSGKRLSWEFLSSLGMDFWQQLPQLAIYYWYLPLIAIAATAVIWQVDKRIDFALTDRKLKWPLGVSILVVLSGLFFVGIRGGLQHKSIQVQSAFVQGHNELGHLTLNTPYHFLRTLRSVSIKERKWLAEDELKREILRLRPDPTYQGQSEHNVVVIILESFSLEYIEQGYAPFLKELSRKGVMFSKNFANGRRSIEALSSIFDSVPSIQDTPFSKSNSQSMPLKGMVSILRERGYQSAFFHGAARGSMGFEAYALSHGVGRYYSRDDYKGDPHDFDGQWGIFDGPYLKFALKEISQMKTPFWAGIFTLSSHQPYAIPKEWQGKFPKGTAEIHESIGYADQMLREFFELAAKEPWYSKTLFVLTADHTQKLKSKKFQNSIGEYRIPLILFHPQVKFDSKLAEKVTQHIDIAPTVLDFLDVPADGLNYAGESVFTPGKGKALQYLRPKWQYIAGERFLHWDEHQADEGSWDAETGVMSPSSETGMVKEAQVFIQYILNGMKKQRWPVVRSN